MLARAAIVPLLLFFALAIWELRGVCDSQVKFLRTALLLELGSWWIGWILQCLFLNNHWVSHWVAPPVDLLLVSALAVWLPRSVQRRVLLGSAIAVAFWLLAEVFLEDPFDFPRLGPPLVHLWVIAAAIVIAAVRARPHLDTYRDGVAIMAIGLIFVWSPYPVVYELTPLFPSMTVTAWLWAGAVLISTGGAILVWVGCRWIRRMFLL